MVNTQYPHEGRSAWWLALEPLTLSVSEKEAIMKIVHYAQPPLSFEALKEAHTLYINDVSPCDVSHPLTVIKNSKNIPNKTPANIGSCYPVFYAFTHSKNINQLSDPLSKKARRFISHFFKDVKISESVTRSQFYKHVLAIRDIIKIIVDTHYPIDMEADTFQTEILKAIKSDTLYYHRKRLEKNKYETFFLLVSGSITPGEKRCDGHSGGKSGGQTDTHRNDPWHDKRLKRLVEAPPPTRRRMRETHDVSNTALDVDIDAEAKALGMTIRSATGQKSTTTQEESSENIVLQRATPSALTLADDRQLTRRFAHSAPASTLAAMADLSRLTPEHVDAVLGSRLATLSHAFAVLLLSTGLSPQRLMQTTVSESLDEVTSDSRDERPHYCPGKNVLCYRLLDGPSIVDADPGNQWIQLRLPMNLATVLNENANQDNTFPFRRARSRLNQQLRRIFRNEPGITPTANRLSASSWLYRRPQAIDDVAAATPAGQFGLALAAPAAYRQLPRAELQQLMDDTLNALAVGEPVTALPNDALPCARPSPCVGSAIAQPPEVFSPIFGAIRDGMHAPRSELSRWWAGATFPIQALVTLYQLVAAHELIGWQLSTGARPVGPRSENCIGDGFQWIRDKNSARGIESRIVPLLHDTRESLRAMQRWTALILHTVAAAGIVLQDRRTGRRDTPTWLYISKKGHRLILRDMMWPDLYSLALPGLSNWPANVTRHSLTSELRLHLPDAEIDALLGHARHGRMLSSPRADASAGQQRELRKALKTWLHESGYTRLKWESMPWFF